MANTKLARSLRVKLQLRDKKGRWIEMGRGGKWYSSLDGSMKSGVVIGSKGNNAIIREKNADGSLGSQNVEVPMNTLEMIPSKASLDPQTLQLMNEYNEGQSAKGKKESDAREKALSDAMAAESKGQAVQDEVEVEYEASAEEELEDLLNDAPQGAMLLKNDASGKHSLKKDADGNWSDGVAAPSNSSTIANSPNTKDYEYVGTGELAKKANEVLAELATGKSAPAPKEKKGWFGKKNKGQIENVDPTDSIIQSNNEKLGLPTSQPQETDPVPEAAETPEVAPEPEALIDISAWKYHQGTQGGSNPGGIYSDPEGNQHYVKHSKSDMHAKNEIMADKFYEKLGIKTSQLKLADVGNGKMGTSSKMVPGSKNDFYQKSHSDPAYLKKFQEDFAADAWLANWDVVGLEYDNVLSDANGDAIRIDPGGALLYRAMGSPKGDMFGPEVGEWESMRNGNNPASDIFGSMTDEDLKNSVAKLKNITDEDIADIVDSMDFEQDVADYLKNTLAARRQNLLNKFPELANEQAISNEQSDLAPSPEETVDAPESVSPETPAQTAKPEPIEGQVVGTDTPFIATPEEALDESPKAVFKAKKESLKAAAQAGEKLDFSAYPSKVTNGDAHYEDYWEEEDDIGPDFAGHFESYTVAEAEALGEYVGGSDEINGILRGNKGVYNYLNEEDFETNAGTINKLDEVIAKSTVQQDTTVYRGIAMKQSTLDSFLENGAYEDLAYSSTSKSHTLANSWASVDPSINPDQLQVVLEMKLPAGFTAHKVDYLAADKKSYANEEEVILPRGTKFAIVETDMGTTPNAGYAKSVVITVEPILNDSNYKPEGIKNGQGSSSTTNTGAGDSAADGTTDTGSNDINGEDVPNGSSGGGYENPSEGADPAGDAAESGSEGIQESEVAPAPVATNVTPAGNDEGEEIPIINGAKAMLSQMAKKQGISIEQLQKDLGIPADGAFPNKGKTVTNDNGDVFEANSIVSNPKFGEGIASIILPSTNSVKVLYTDHGFKVTQAKNLGLVSGTAPQEVASQAVDLSGAASGDVGINPANGKMYFVDKNGNAKYVGDEVEYTKKGVTQHGKVASIYKGTKTAKIEWDDDTASVKKASQLVGKEDSSTPTNDNTDNTPETPVSEPVAQTPDNAPEDATPVEDSTTPAPVEEPIAEAPEATENKGWTPAEGYDPMGPTKIQIHPDMKTAIVYAHDNSELNKNDYNLTNKVGYNPIEEKFFGTGHNLQPLYEGDKVDYLFNGTKYSGEIIEVKPKAQSAVVLLDDGTKKLKKFSQLSGNYPKTVSVDEDGNYTDWSGNAAQIPNFKGSATETVPEDVTPEEVVPETPQNPKVEWADIVNAEIGQTLQIGDDTFIRMGDSYYGKWWDTKNGVYVSTEKIFNLQNNHDSSSISEVPVQNLSEAELDVLGNAAQISSDKLNTTLTKDSDGDWYSPQLGYFKGSSLPTKALTDDWEITSAGKAKPQFSSNDLDDLENGQVFSIGDSKYFKINGTQWWSPEDKLQYSSSELISMTESTSEPVSVRVDTAPTSNLTPDELSEMNTGAEIHSEKMNMTLEKDSDGDWTGFGMGYYPDDEVLDYIVSDDWVINSTGSIEPNYSTYDLDGANGYSELYSNDLDKNFTKEQGSSQWVDIATGTTYSSDELLSEFPTDDWSLNESEIDDSYSYGMEEYDLQNLNPGSTISHTESSHDSPDTFIKIGDDEWVLTDYAGLPNFGSQKYSDSDFEDGYSYISHEAEEGEYEAPELLNIISNTPDISKDEITLEWFENAPAGTSFKSEMSSKWTYTKNEEGTWNTVDEYGNPKPYGVGGTNQQVFDASSDKWDVQNVFVPNTEESTESTETVIPDLEVGTFMPSQEGSVDTGFTKIGDNQWKMKSAGQEVDHVLGDDFIIAFQKATNSAPIAPTPATEDNTASEPLPDIIKPTIPEVAPSPENGSDSEPLPDIVKPVTNIEDVDVLSLPNLQHMSPEDFDALPIGTKLFKHTVGANNDGFVYEKITDTGVDADWLSYPTGGTPEDSKAKFENSVFHTIIDMEIAKSFKILKPAGNTEESSANIPTPESSKTYPEFLADMTLEEFKDLPLGSILTPNWGDTTYEKTSDSQWTSTSGSLLTNDNFEYYVGLADNPLSMSTAEIKVTTPDKNTPASKSLFDMTPEEIMSAPVGSVVKHFDASPYTKGEDGLWHSSDPAIESDDGLGISWVAGKTMGKNYTFTPGTGGEVAPKYPETLSGFASTEQFNKLPVGSTIGTDATPDIYTKTGINEWSTKNGSKKLDETFHYLITTGTGDPYKINVPEDGAPVNINATDASSVDKPIYGMTLQELEDAPEGSTLSYVGDESYNAGKVLTKNAEGEWVSNSTGQANDTSGGLMYFAGSELQGPAWIFHKADGTEAATTPTPDEPKKLTDLAPSEITNLPAGTKLTLGSTVLTKKEDSDWVSGSGSIYTNGTIESLSSDYDGSSWIVSAPDGVIDSPYAGGTHKSVKVSPELADGYPVGTVVKKDLPAFYGKSGQHYYVKQEDGSWQAYKQTDKTLAAKNIYQSSLFSGYGFASSSVSVPKAGDHFISHTGELGYIGDSVDYDGGIYKVAKVMKTGVKLTDGYNTVTVKPQKLNLSGSTFGLKDLPGSGSGSTQSSSQPSASPAADVDLGYEANASNDFAGASAEEYNKQGLTMPYISNPQIIPAFTLSPTHEPDPSHELYGAPQPEEPAKPNAYPAFSPPKLELPEWDSEAWLAKVEQRYLDNPNKAKSTVQQSNKWTAIQEVMKGDKSNLDSLLSSKYLDEDLYNEAISGIDNQTAKNQPLMQQHEDAVEAAKAQYDIDKTNHLANYTALKSEYDAKLLSWMSANPDPKAMKPLNKPAVSSENFTGGAADWNKSHIGTHTAETVFATIKPDNHLGKHGLSIATDADKVEGLDVNVTKTLTPSGDEVLDLRFKVTQSHGKIMADWAKKLTGVKKTTTIHPPSMVLDTKSGLLKESVGSNQGAASGERFEITHEETGARIIFQRDKGDKPFNNDTNHNSVRVVMPLTSTPEQYQQVLDFMGIEGKPASEGDIRVLAENKIIGLMGDGIDAIGAGNLKGEKRKKALEDIKSEFGVSPEDVVFQADINGRVRLFFNDKATKKLASKLSHVKTFSHNLSSGSDVDTMMNILTGPHPGLLSTYHRWSNGMSQQGMSSSQDMKYGSGDYIYTTPHTKMYVSGNNVSIHPEAILRKLDAWANAGDSYGKKNSDGYDMGAYKKLLKLNGSLHEYLPTGSVSINDMQYISVYSGMRDDLIKRLKAMGILKINGFNLEDFIISQGMTPPESDYIPGIGVVPVGTVIDPSLLGPSAPAGDMGGEAAGVGGPAI